MKTTDIVHIQELFKQLKLVTDGIHAIKKEDWGLPKDTANTHKDNVLRVGVNDDITLIFRGCINRAGFKRGTGIAIKGLLLSDLRGQVVDIARELKSLGVVVEVDE